jgi:cell division transport system permease protein
LERATKEALVNLARNVPYAVAGVITTMVSLMLVGIALLGKQGVDSFASQWANGIDFKVWMKPDATSAEVAAVRQELARSPNIKRFDYVDHIHSYQLVQRIFSNEKVIAQAFTPDTTPTFFEAVLKSPQLAPAAYQEFVDMPGVMTPQYPQQALRTLEEVTSIMQVVLFGIAALMLVAAFVLVFVTIRMAIFSRRREIAVMRLVGATSWFIRLPFIMEGLLEGLAGSIVAALAVWGIRYLIHDYVVRTLSGPGSEGPSLLQSAVASSSDALVTGAILVLIGALVSVGGSVVAIRRFLRV